MIGLAMAILTIHDVPAALTAQAAEQCGRIKHIKWL